MASCIAMVHRFGAAPQLQRLLAVGVPHATTPWAKSLVDESAAAFAGTYSGATGSTEDTRRTIEDAAALILAGVQITDLNSGLFSQRITRARTIELGARSASVGAATFAPLELPTALAALEPLVAGLERSAPARPATPEPTPEPAADDAPLSQDALWQETAQFLQAGDIVLADQGTCFYGMAPHRLPADVTFVGQPLWASIGYTLPALLGACTAQPASAIPTTRTRNWWRRRTAVRRGGHPPAARLTTRRNCRPTGCDLLLGSGPLAASARRRRESSGGTSR